MGIARRVTGSIVGERVELPAVLLATYPQLRRVRLRRGGLPPRVGGWFLRQPSVAAITLWHTIWLGVETTPSAGLLLHEFCHVQQFEADPAFPLRYLWECITRGYHANRYEVDARRFAHVSIVASAEDSPSEDA